MYDVASLTKVLATTPIVMKLVQKKKIGLNYPLSDFYPEFSIKEKEKITIKHLLTHTSGLKPYVEYYKKEGFDSIDSFKSNLTKHKLASFHMHGNFWELSNEIFNRIPETNRTDYVTFVKKIKNCQEAKH